MCDLDFEIYSYSWRPSLEGQYSILHSVYMLPSMHTYIVMFFVCGRTGINLAQNKIGPADRGFVIMI